MPLIKSAKLGDVQPTGLGEGELGHSFSIQTAFGAPLVTIIYRTAAEAAAAREQMAELLKAAVVATPG
jgi:hypothetical protein